MCAVNDLLSALTVHLSATSASGLPKASHLIRLSQMASGPQPWYPGWFEGSQPVMSADMASVSVFLVAPADDSAPGAASPVHPASSAASATAETTSADLLRR